MVLLQRNYVIAIGFTAIVILLLVSFSPLSPIQPAVNLASKQVGEWRKTPKKEANWHRGNWDTTEAYYSVEDEGDLFSEDEDIDEETEELQQYIDAKSERGGGKEENLVLVEKYREEARKKKDDKYLIYLCDDKVPCSGFADRQRAIVGIYLLSIVTNRTFGIIMTNPAMITDFYVPTAEVNWDIKAADLAGKSSVVVSCVQKSLTCSFKDLNTKYPQDVVYIRSRSDYLNVVGTVGKYRKLLPEWATGAVTTLYGEAWTRLMMPSKMIRQEMNKFLSEIRKGMQQDVKIIPQIQETDSCRSACKSIIVLGKADSRFIDVCLEKLQMPKKVEKEDGVEFLRHLCPVKKAIIPPPLNDIKYATGYDYVELELVCAQIRLGRSSTIEREPVFNELKDVVNVWKLLRPYINRGHHMFLASDAQEVRDQAKEYFGSRVHVNTDPIVHINKVNEEQDGWLGMKTALEEQLLLSTSCKVLVFTQSGFGRRSSMLRHVLTKGREGFETFSFSEGKVSRMNLDHKPKMLPSPRT